VFVTADRANFMTSGVRVTLHLPGEAPQVLNHVDEYGALGFSRSRASSSWSGLREVPAPRGLCFVYSISIPNPY
jgi:hypothetical protein